MTDVGDRASVVVAFSVFRACLSKSAFAKGLVLVLCSSVALSKACVQMLFIAAAAIKFVESQ